MFRCRSLAGGGNIMTHLLSPLKPSNPASMPTFPEEISRNSFFFFFPHVISARREPKHHLLHARRALRYHEGDRRDAAACVSLRVSGQIQRTFQTLYRIFLPVVAVVLLFSHPHPSPLLTLHLFAPGPRVLPDPAHGKVCLCPRLLSYFCLSRLFPLSSYFCLLSAFISLTSGWRGAQLPEQYKSIT